MGDRKTIMDLGLEVISAINVDELTPLEIRDILYNTVIKNYETIGRILETARKEGLVERGESVYRITPQSSKLEFERPKVISREENARCGLCGKNISTGYYIELRSRTLGPYGSGCIRKIKLGFMDWD